MRAEAHSIFERIVPLVFFCAIAIATGPIQAQSYTVLYPFASGYQSPRGLVQASDGNFYGTEGPGGANGLGSVFKVTPAGTLTTIHSFSGSDGENPYGTLVQGTDGSFYGTTYKGGAGGIGTIFRITSSGTLTTLYSFGGSDGARPYAGLVQGTDGNFYGTTNSGGASDNGAVFKITPAGALTTIYSFKGSDGANPYAGLAQGTDGNFYGTTTYGGEASDYGTVFKITPAGALTTLYTFGWGEGAYPDAGLVQGTDGNFYGTTPRAAGMVSARSSRSLRRGH